MTVDFKNQLSSRRRLNDNPLTAALMIDVDRFLCVQPEFADRNKQRFVR